ncbi:GTPase HflX [Clostridioides difficile]|uniref:GTPase HflX n=2 Tax=Bacillota TaxID=1239 RepID=UPI001CC59E1E|nr:MULTISPECIES: GTPase HflX [Paraclostridium]MBZ6007588.1 GTPase HflX [Paraclostridium bifermentans]MDB3083666.1 GTPase HflX [Clostridioides difficile]MDU0296609.1 GTPase HflX [Paraclostridium sp. MRS3W1]UOW69748.1 GTPase HflX [Paraclostridium bifermentans]
MNMRKKGILIGININNKINFDESMIELKNLCQACEIDEIAQIKQNAKKVNSKFYMGSGKIKELRDLIIDKDVDIVVFNNELSASQIKNIEDEIECSVIDRTALILDIFANRAKTREAKLQVEIARLQYELPRIIDDNEDLGRQGGGAGLKNRGSGETKLELELRRIKDRIVNLNKELETVMSQREIQKSKRKKSSIPNVALVGYTNAGKSSVMNVFVEKFINNEDKKVFEKNMLFATLETYVRNIKLPDNRSFLLSDTVGFVGDLPHNLVKAFRSTLEEVCDADLLLHIVDISNPNYENHIKVTNETLRQIGAENIPSIYVFNKSDLIELDELSDDRILISAKNNIGIDELVESICKQIFADYINLKIEVPYIEAKMISYIMENEAIINFEYTENGVMFHIECSKVEYVKYKEFII